MKLLITALLSTFLFFSKTEKDITVYYFLAEECKIAQFYTMKMNELHDKYKDKSIDFKGVFPNPSSTETKIEDWVKKYNIPFDCALDEAQSLTHEFEVTVTPEVVVVDNQSNEVLYQGRIDNSYFRVGRKRSVTTVNDLEVVLEAIDKGEPVPYKKTNPIGCFITKTKKKACCKKGAACCASK